MNIFATSPCPVESASALADQHVIKMCCETAQILSAALHLRGEADGLALYKPTHTRHPCVVWSAASLSHLDWLARHGMALCAEYTRRFGKVHGSLRVINAVSDRIYDELLNVWHVAPVTFALAMPDEFRQADAHSAYRAYLNAKYRDWTAEAQVPGSRKRAPKWTKRDPPSWYDQTTRLPMIVRLPLPPEDPDPYEPESFLES